VTTCGPYRRSSNLHYTLSLDLFGSEVSTNAANAFNAWSEGPLPRDRDRETTHHKIKNEMHYRC